MLLPAYTCQSQEATRTTPTTTAHKETNCTTSCQGSIIYICFVKERTNESRKKLFI